MSGGGGTRRAWLMLGAGGLLAGCGFRPVYMASGPGGAGPSAELAAIDVKPMTERPGQILRESLKARLASDGGVPRKYDLQVSFWITGEGIGVLSLTQFTRVRLIGNASWNLVNRDVARTPLTSGTDRILDGYDIHETQYFAADMENEQVQRRIATQMADRIALRLAVWFQQHPVVKAG